MVWVVGSTALFVETSGVAVSALVVGKTGNKVVAVTIQRA